MITQANPLAQLSGSEKLLNRINDLINFVNLNLIIFLEQLMKKLFIVFISLVLTSCSKGHIQAALCNGTGDKSMTECSRIIEHEKIMRENNHDKTL